MKLSEFIEMCEDRREVFNVLQMGNSIYKEVLTECFVNEYLKMDNKIDGIIEHWSLDVVSWDYPVINIYLK